VQTTAFFVSGQDLSDETRRTYRNGLDRFRVLAERAWECLVSLPADVFDCVPPELAELRTKALKSHPSVRPKPRKDRGQQKSLPDTCEFDALLPSGGDPVDLWLGYLHWLAWSTKEGSPLRAKRMTWNGSTDMDWFATRKEFDAVRRCLPGQTGFTFESTRHYYSILEDLFLSSALAIDAIESKLNQDPSRGVKDLEANRPKARRPGGRPSDTDHKKDKRVAEAWDSGNYSTYAELARELKMSPKDVEYAIWRHRKRQPPRRKKSNQEG
jgi:hypothetical protein